MVAHGGRTVCGAAVSFRSRVANRQVCLDDSESRHRDEEAVRYVSQSYKEMVTIFHTLEEPQTSLPTSFFTSSGPAAPRRVRRFSISFFKVFSSVFSVRVMISSRIGREL